MNKRLPFVLTRHDLLSPALRVWLCMLLLITCGAAVNAQPVMISSIESGSTNFVNISGRLYFSASSNLYGATPGTGPELIKNTGENIIAIYNTPLAGNFFFVTQSGTMQSLWRSDGTNSNTVKITTETQITPLAANSSLLFMRVNSTAYGSELWKVDLSFNASIVKDINPGTPNGFQGYGTIYNNEFYFFSNVQNGYALWKSNGTEAGTVIAVDLDDENVQTNSVGDLITVGNALYFSWEYGIGDEGELVAELWKTNGSPAGSAVMIRFPYGYAYNYLSDFTEVNGKLFFFHTEGDYPEHFISVSDGTPQGTRHIARVSVDGSPEKIVDGGDYAVYYASSQGNATPIEKTDGVSTSTVHEFSYYHETQEQTIRLTATGGRAFFLDDLGDYYAGDMELWQADLSTGITQSLQEIYGFSFAGSNNIVADNGNIYFTRTSSGQMTLWYYNPNNSPGSVCQGAGSIEREKWANVSGTSVTQIPLYTEDPSTVTSLGNFSTPRNEGDNYGDRIRGYICVPQDGNYVFYISSDDNSELWLSTDENPSNKRLIASSKYTAYNQWDKYPSQQSAQIALQRGIKYYIEALHKEGTGSDHLSVGWKLPDGTLERPIPGSRLIPFKRGSAPVVYLYNPYEGQQFQAPANVPIRAEAWDQEGMITKVQFYASGQLLAEKTAEPYTYIWENVPVGTYAIEARATDNEGNIRTSTPVNISVNAPSCAGTGGLQQEIWYNVAGTDVRTFNYASQSNGSRYLTTFETDQYFANNYASRMRAYICVPQTGAYTFWISSDDSSELYLSTDESEANKRLIAWVYGATPYRKYDKYGSQKSALITLEAGRKYFIEARHKEGTGNDFISVGWTLPDGTLERPMSGNRLIGIPLATDYPTSVSITSPEENSTFTQPASVRLAATASDANGIKNVKFYYSTNGVVTQLTAFTNEPYEYQWNNVAAGEYNFVVTVTDNLDNTTSTNRFFTVTGGSCTGTGTIVREVWTGIGGTSISSIPVNSTPNRLVQLTSFSTQNYYGNDYGSRIRGYVCAPETGAYTFWIAGDDNSELWLSSNDDPSSKTRIAYAGSSTAVNQWTKYPTQTSARVNLVRGQRYYIEVLHKEANGADHVEVGWQLPSGSLERPIPGDRIIPFEDLSTSAAAFETAGIFETEEQHELSVYPNPVVSGNEFEVTLPGADDTDVNVDIVSLTGVSVQSERRSGSNGQLIITLSRSVMPGMYLIRVAGDKKRWTKKIQVN